MKLAYLFARYPVPSQTFCDTEMRTLEAAGWDLEIHVVSPPLTSFRHGRDTRPAAPVFYAPHGRVLDRLEARARREGRWPAALIAEHETRFGPRHVPARRARHALYFADLCRRHGVAHVHVHFAADAVHTALFLEGFGGPSFSFTAHGQDFMLDLANDDLLREMAGRSRFVVAVSDWSRDLLRAKCPASAERIVRVYNGLPIEPRTKPEPPARAGLPSQVLRILSVGRLIEFKGFHVLIAACAELARRGLSFSCEIIGEGPWRAELERAVREHDLGDRVALPGLRDQGAVRRAMAECDVFALACVVDQDGACDVLPTVILEAMAAGKPVVSTTLAGVPELVVDRETGRLAPPSDAPALADALAEFLHDPARREACGQAGRLRLERHFRADDSARQLGELLASTRPATRIPRLPITPPRLLWLLADDPPDRLADAGRLPAELRRLRERLAEDAPTVLRIVALRPPTKRLHPDDLAAGRLPDADPWWLDAIDTFLADGMVLEAEWRERVDLAHRLESWREEMNGSMATEEFLLQARRSLWLFTTFRGAAGPTAAAVPLHVHAEGRGALLCAALLQRLAGGDTATASFSVAGGKATPELPGSALRRLAGRFAGGRVSGDAPLVRALGEWPVELTDDGEGFVERVLAWAGYGPPRPHAAEVWDD